MDKEHKGTNFSESPIVRGLIVDPAAFEKMQIETRRSMQVVMVLQEVVKRLDSNPQLLLDEYKKLGLMGKAMYKIYMDVVDETMPEELRASFKKNEHEQ